MRGQCVAKHKKSNCFVPARTPEPGRERERACCTGNRQPCTAKHCGGRKEEGRKTPNHSEQALQPLQAVFSPSVVFPLLATYDRAPTGISCSGCRWARRAAGKGGVTVSWNRDNPPTRAAEQSAVSHRYKPRSGAFMVQVFEKKRCTNLPTGVRPKEERGGVTRRLLRHRAKAEAGYART